MRPRKTSQPESAGKKNVLFLGVGFSLQPSTSDKNFWRVLIPELAGQMEQVVVVSVNTSSEPYQKQGNIFVYNLPPFFSRRQKTQSQKNPYLYKHSFWWGTIEKSLTFLRLVPLLAKLVKRHRVGVIHLMDSFGFMNRFLKVAFPSRRVGLTLLTFNVHGLSEKTYASYQRMALAKLDYLVATSQTSQAKLVDSRIKIKGVTVIRAGIDREHVNSHPAFREKRAARKSLVKNCLWTGFIQQICEESFWFTYRLAKRLTAENPKIRFTFAFKPECLEDKFVLSDPKITVLSTTPEQFRQILADTHLLVSPIVNFRSVCGPPLSWVECLSRGIPIVSTPAPGVEEILTIHQAGSIGKTEEELILKIGLLLNDRKAYRTLSGNARRLVQKEFLIEKVASQYLKLWENGNGIPG